MSEEDIYIELFTSRIKVKPGEFIVLYGEKGVGKSTCINAIQRNYPDRSCLLVTSERTSERQNVAIVRAVAYPTNIYLFDEPTSFNTFRENRIELLYLIKKLHDQGNTIVMATWDQGAIEMGTRVIELFENKTFIDHGPGLFKLL